MAMACLGVKAAGSRTSQSPLRRALPAMQPQCVSPTPQPLCTKASPAFQFGWLDSSTVPAPSMPATMGQLRTTGALLQIARPSL